VRDRGSRTACSSLIAVLVRQSASSRTTSRPLRLNCLASFRSQVGHHLLRVPIISTEPDFTTEVMVSNRPRHTYKCTIVSMGLSRARSKSRCSLNATKTGGLLSARVYGTTCTAIRFIRAFRPLRRGAVRSMAPIVAFGEVKRTGISTCTSEPFVGDGPVSAGISDHDFFVRTRSW
jgi:hypothetical protein